MLNKTSLITLIYFLQKPISKPQEKKKYTSDSLSLSTFGLSRLSQLVSLSLSLSLSLNLHFSDSQKKKKNLPFSLSISSSIAPPLPPPQVAGKKR